MPKTIKVEALPYALAPFGTYANSYEPGQCTNYAASRVKVPNSWGNANTWAEQASQDGYTVSSVPVVGAIAQTSRGSFGHVGVVEAIRPGEIQMAEQNYDYNGSIRTSWQSAAQYTYIYPR